VFSRKTEVATNLGPEHAGRRRGAARLGVPCRCSAATKPCAGISRSGVGDFFVPCLA
jgi:hypothetical protein